MTDKHDLTLEDRLEIGNLFARYGRLVDGGDAEGYADLYTEDGSFDRINPLVDGTGSGLPAQAFRGRAALAQLVRDIAVTFQGKMRHQLTDIYVEPTGEPGEARGTCYALITDWRDGPGKLSMHATYRMSIVRTDDGWRFKDVTIERLPAA